MVFSPNFNPNLVRFKHGTGLNFILTVLDFNPNLVRFKPEGGGDWTAGALIFQS